MPTARASGPAISPIRIVVAAWIAAAWLAPALPVLAACALTHEAVARADVAFVGTLVAVRAEGGRASFEIEEVWNGVGLVIGTPSPEIAASSGMFQMPGPGEPAARYLVLAKREADGLLWTGNDCDHGRYAWDPSLAEFRPIPPPATDQGFAPLVGLIAAAAVIAIVGFIAFRRRGRAV